MGSNSPVKVLFVGDVNGNFDALFARVAKVHASHGPFDVLFCVGRFFGPSVEGTDDVEYAGQLEAYLEGSKVAPVPTYFVGGFGHGSRYVIEKLSEKTSCGIHYLGRGGLATIKSLQVAFLDGLYNAAVFGSDEDSHVYYSKAEVDKVRKAIMGMQGDVDVLLTNDWPEGVMRGVGGAGKDVVSSPLSGPVADLALLARPRYHIAGTNSKYFARVPYINEDKGTGRHVTRFLGMGPVGNAEKQKWIQALGLVPCERMEPGQFKAIPPESTKCPYSGFHGRKRDVDETSLHGEQPWRWQDATKRQKMPVAAPSLGRQDVVKDRSKTIFVRNVPFAATEEELIAYFSSAGKVVDVVRKANTDGKLNTYCHIQFSTKEEMDKACQLNEQELMGRQLFIEPAAMQKRKRDAAPVEGCWFCLSNPNADVNLVCSIGQELYVALDKGAITPLHVLLVPVEHHACSLDLPESGMDELARYLSALSSFFASQGKAMVGFERFMRLKKSGGNHCHINIIGLPLKDAANARQAFVDAGRKLGHTFTPIEKADVQTTVDAMKDIVGDGEYFCAILPDGSRLIHPIAYGERHPLSFGRDVLASLAKVPERADWKLCKVSEQEEIENTEQFKTKFKPYDIMFD